MPYKLIDEIAKEKEKNREKERKLILSSLKELLPELAGKYDFSKAYIFGSLVKPGKFQNRSDIDIAIFNLKDEFFFSLMAEISRHLFRDIDLYQIENLDEYLRKRIEKEGELWTKEC